VQMARIRTIKVGFWTSPQVTECSPIARLLFIGLWTFSDDAGISPASLSRAKMQIFPGDDFSTQDIQSWINELIQQGLLREYTTEDNRSYWIVTGWKAHQRIDRPSYYYPQPKAFDISDCSTNDRRIVTESSTTEKEKEKENTIVAKATGDIESVFNYWREKTNHLSAKLDSKRKSKIGQALNMGFSVAALKQAVDGCISSKFHMGENDQKRKYDSVDLVFRNAEKIEEFERMAKSKSQASDDIFLGAE
jgi:hypothetical protein